MSDRESELRQLIAELREHEAIEDAFLAKSFTDRLVIIDVSDGDEMPGEVVDRLADHDVRERDDTDGVGGSFPSDVGDATRHHFVDVQTRGAHQSYVVDGYGSL